MTPLDTLGFKVGDPVRVGGGSVLWKIGYFWSAPDGKTMAQLGPTGSGYTSASAEVSRLVKAS